MSGKTRWITPAGDPSPELVDLISRAITGERWADIGATFYPNSYYGHKKANDIFTAYASAIDKAERHEALVRKGFNGRGGQFGKIRTSPALAREPAVLREKRDPWADMGACFAAQPRLAAE